MLALPLARIRFGSGARTVYGKILRPGQRVRRLRLAADQFAIVNQTYLCFPATYLYDVFSFEFSPQLSRMMDILLGLRIALINRRCTPRRIDKFLIQFDNSYVLIVGCVWSNFEIF